MKKNQTIPERQERRAVKRFEVRLTGTVRLKIEGRELQGEVTTKNISAYGAYLLTDTWARVGDRVTLHLQGPSESKIKLQTIGKVLRVEKLSEKRWGLAIKFDAILDLGEM